MAVNRYDGHTAFLQDTLSRFGEERAEAWSKLNDNQDRGWLDERKREVDEAALHKLSSRDKDRSKTDPSFQPKDDDFSAPPSFRWNPSVNYYKVLGVDELASQSDVKTAYKKLSLTYHPDKTRDLPQEERDEHAAVFIELKNAYKLLSDNPSRRQYDYERDRNVARSELRGKPLPREEAAFNAAEALSKLAEKMGQNKRKPSNTVKVNLKCSLEKFVHGGHKAVERERKVRVKFSVPPEFETEKKLYRVSVPPGSEPPYRAELQRQGDHHEDREPDHLHILMAPKPHGVVEPQGRDLHLQERLDLGEVWDKPYLSTQVPSVRGRHLLLWGRNPFFRAEGADRAELRVRVLGEGIGGEGSFCCVARCSLVGATLGAGNRGSARHVRPSRAAALDQRQFIERFGLGPLWGFEEAQPGAAGGDVSQAPAMQRRLRTRAARVPTCDLELVALGEATVLYTWPPCGVTFYCNARAPPQGGLGPCSVFAIGIASPPCARKAAAHEWNRLRHGLAPVLLRTGFQLLKLARCVLPRTISNWPAFPGWAQLSGSGGEGEAWEPAPPWPALAAEAFQRGDLWTAAALYGRALEAAGEDVEAAVKALANRATCLAKLSDFVGSLEDARKARDLAPDWARPWSRIGIAASQLDASFQQEALAACHKAVELEASEANVQRLSAVAARLQEPSLEASHAAKEKGAEAWRLHEIGSAVAHYTCGLALLPESTDPATAGEDEHSLLRAVLLTNRSAALAQLGRWDAAANDGRAAVKAKPDFLKAHCQLGVALLGQGLNEQAYSEFARAVLLDEENHRAQKGRKACLMELQRWRSAPARARFARRFYLDLQRPAGSTRIFAVSDVNFGRKCNEAWAHSIDGSAFQDDVLIIAGNLSEAMGGIVKGLTTLKSKFRRVFFTIGNQEMAIHHTEAGRYADSLAKLFGIFDACDELGVDVFPAPICSGVSVFPLLSWYNSSFDEKDPLPNPSLQFDSRCRWPVDADEQLWKYMLKLNEPHLRVPHHGTVVTFSAFLPRRGLPIGHAYGLVKAVGCEALDEQIRGAGSQLHVFGRSGVRHAQVHSGLRYVQSPVSDGRDRAPDEVPPPLMLVHNGQSVCMHEWGVDDTMQTRVLRIALLVMPGINENAHKRSDLFAISRKFNTLPGVKASFGHMGCSKMDKEDFVEKAWPELAQLSCGATHTLVVIADNLGALRGFLHSDLYLKEWSATAGPFTENSVELVSPLGLELAPEAPLPGGAEKSDPALIFNLMNLQGVSEGSEAYMKMLAALAAINSLPGAAGRIAASLKPAGFNRHSAQAVLGELHWPDDKTAGCTHCFTVAVDSPESFRLLRQSKTFSRFKASYEPLLQKHLGWLPPQLAGVVPLKLTANTSAPRAAGAGGH